VRRKGKNRGMLRLRAFALIASLCGSGGVALGEDGLRGLLPSDIAWEQRRSSPDVFYAGIYGEPAKPGPYAFRVRAQAGHSLPPHTHPDERTVTVLSGTYWSGVGETFDEAKLEARDFDDQGVIGGIGEIGEGCSDVPGRGGVETTGVEHRRGRLGDTGLPVGAGDGCDGSLEVLECELDLAPDGKTPHQCVDDGT